MSRRSIIYLEDVTVAYDGFRALSHLNFFVDHRELRVVIGPHGAGKMHRSGIVRYAGGCNAQYAGKRV